MRAYIPLPGREAEALHRLVEKEFPCLGILHQVDYGVEETVEHQLGCPSGHGDPERGLARALTRRFKVYVLGIRRPGDGDVRSLVEGQLHSVASAQGHCEYVAVALVVGAESQPLAVGGYQRRILNSVHSDYGRGLPSGSRDRKDVAVITEINLLPVRRQGWMGSKSQILGKREDGCQKNISGNENQSFHTANIVIYLMRSIYSGSWQLQLRQVQVQHTSVRR